MPRKRLVPSRNTQKELLSFAFLRLRRTWLLSVQRTARANKCANIYSVRALNIFVMFGGVLDRSCRGRGLLKLSNCLRSADSKVFLMLPKLSVFLGELTQ